MLDIARKHGVTVPISMLNLSGLVQVQEQDPMTFTNFLDKFKTLRLFYKSPDVIHRVTREAVEDAAHDNVRYMELRFTPVALSRAEGFPLHDVMDWVITSSQAAAKDFGINYPLMIGNIGTMEWSQQAGNRAGVLPFTLVFDRQGNVVARQVGEIKPARLAELVLPLL